MFTLLEKMVLIQSGTYNKQGVDRMVRLIISTLQSNAVSFKVMEQDIFGNHLVVRSLCEMPFDKQILLTGHMDTVFPEDTEFNWYKEESTHCFGPGVIDMKGGLVAGIFALKALDNEKLLTKMPVTFFFNSRRRNRISEFKRSYSKGSRKQRFCICFGNRGAQWRNRYRPKRKPFS